MTLLSRTLATIAASFVLTVGATSLHAEGLSLPKIEHAATLVLPSIGLVVGGVSVAVAAGGGLYWVLGAILLAFVSASVNAWVLLVEIKR